jgi:enterochelin esterase-like enzyme
VPEPQSTLFFLLMMVLFGGCMWWLITAKQMVFRVLAACLAFVPAMMFGVAAVNKYYDYYQNWHAAVQDLTNQGPQAVVVHSNTKPGTGFANFLGHTVDTSLARQQGLLLTDTIHGTASNITRTVYVFLPPQYFQRSFRKYRFPAIELLHGFPGLPVDWVTVLGVNSLLNSLVSQDRAKPAVLIMPDANGGRGISLQCLNQFRGPADATYLAKDLPDYISRHLRVQAPGHGWGIAGYSEGGFCAANLGLQYGGVFSYSGVLSGYFVPSDNQLMNPSRQVNPFGGNKLLAAKNTPLKELKTMPAGRPIPQFWLGAGELDNADVRSAYVFGQLLQNRQPAVTEKLVPGGGHTMLTWRQLLPPMLEWMTQGLSQQVALHEARVAKQHAGAAGAKRHRLEEEKKLHATPTSAPRPTSSAHKSPPPHHK